MPLTHIHTLLNEMIAQKASDLYLVFENPPSLRVNDAIIPYGETLLTDENLSLFLSQLLTEDQHDEFRSTFELNIALNFDKHARFRINVFRQQNHDGIVIRRIETKIPTLASLNLPPIYGQLVMEKRGLILVSGPTGSGKSTSLAAMVGHRNSHGQGHIITVEDPIEFVHERNQCIISQRDVGLDT